MFPLKNLAPKELIIPLPATCVQYNTICHCQVGSVDSTMGLIMSMGILPLHDLLSQPKTYASHMDVSNVRCSDDIWALQPKYDTKTSEQPYEWHQKWNCSLLEMSKCHMGCSHQRGTIQLVTSPYYIYIFSQGNGFKQIASSVSSTYIWPSIIRRSGILTSH